MYSFQEEKAFIFILEIWDLDDKNIRVTHTCLCFEIIPKRV